MRSFLLLLPLAVVGCGDGPAIERVTPGPRTDTGSRFDPATASRVTGVVRWKGESPTVDGFRSIDDPFTDQLPPRPREWPNPHAPCLDSRTRGLGGVVVYLQGIDPVKGRRWDHAPVTIDLGDEIAVIQGNKRGRTGYVQAGAAIRVKRSREAFASLRGRGAVSFGLTLPRRDEARSHTLAKTGLVELSSGTGQYWMRATLFVDDHPYYTRTDDQGRFTLDQVPPGTYDLVAWMPNWQTAAVERQPDSYRIIRLEFKKAFQTKRRITVSKGGTPAIEMELGDDATAKQ